ncbi:Retrovirus-related Pol polyprotein from transposon TNT 1-94 [Cardamine amara subsp. amara]|uniref:Retrovirus-related Pol polyprotein from transposon TNT 1-94 n=1 Tax=Cardamine amara subsp. amara TaxID=228776 RepID=A0ABD1AQ00_CARAN
MFAMNVKIDKFSGRNSFGLWQIKMKALLKQQSLWAPLSKDKGGDAAEMATLEEKAHSTILLCLKDEVIIEVSDQTTVPGLWKKLENLYMTKSLQKKLLLKRCIFALRMQPDRGLKNHLDQLNSILLDLRNIDVKVEDKDAALLLLVSLPQSYENFVESFIVNKDKVTLEEVRSALHSRELRRQAGDTATDNQAAGLVASGSNGLRYSNNRNKRLFSKGPKPDDICNYCKEKGHWKFECPKKKQSGYAAVAEDDIKSEQDVALVAGGDTHASDVWVLDTGASYHMCPSNEWFEIYTIVDGGNIKMANSSVSKVAGIGSIRIKTHDGRFVTLNDVRHVPSMEKNLISVSLLDSRGFQYSGGDGVLKVYQGSDVILKGFMRGTLYILQGSTVSGSVNVASAEIHKEDMTKLWHMRLGHMSERGMQILSKENLLCGHEVKSLEFCEHCVFGKLHRSKFSKAAHITKGTLYYIHSDCWGPARVDSLGGHRYFVSFIDDYSRKTWVIMLKHKNEAFKNFREWKTLVENQTGKKIKRLRTDNGLEFCSSEFNQLYKDQGVARHHTVRNTPQQNGVAERMNQTLLERARCMLSNAGLERRFWAEAVSTTCYLINRGPHTSIKCKIPAEVWSGKSVDYSHLKVFGCTVYYHVSEGKLEPRAMKGVFMGYGDGVKGYRIWSPSENRVILSRNVVFDESSMLGCYTRSITEAESCSFDKQVELNEDHQGGDQQEHN